MPSFFRLIFCAIVKKGKSFFPVVFFVSANNVGKMNESRSEEGEKSKRVDPLPPTLLCKSAN